MRTSLIALEATTFQQDLNGDHTTGIPAGSGSDVATLSLCATMAGSGNDNFVFRADLGAAPAATHADNFELHQPSSTGGTNIGGLPNNVHDHWQTAQSAFDDAVVARPSQHRGSECPSRRPSGESLHHSLTSLG
jgi:hypothetical protein